MKTVGGPRLRYRLAALVAVALWGGSFTAIRLLIDTVPTPLLVFSRLALASVFLFAIAFVTDRGVSLKHLRAVALLAFIGIFAHQWLQTSGMETAHAITAGVIVAVIPVWTAILGALFLRERLAGVQLIGVAAAFVGVVIVVDAPQALIDLAVGGVTRGDLLVLGSTFLWAGYTILLRRNQEAQSGVGDTSLLFALAALMFVPFVPWSDALSIWSGMTPVQWSALWCLGIGASGIAFWLWSYALRDMKASEASAWIYTEPLFAAAFAIALLGERPTHTLAIGAVVVLIGVALTQRVFDAVPVVKPA